MLFKIHEEALWLYCKVHGQIGRKCMWSLVFLILAAYLIGISSIPWYHSINQNKGQHISTHVMPLNANSWCTTMTIRSKLDLCFLKSNNQQLILKRRFLVKDFPIYELYWPEIGKILMWIFKYYDNVRWKTAYLRYNAGFCTIARSFLKHHELNKM